MPDLEGFGNRVRQLREGLNLTRQQLAERAGVPLRSLEKWEQGAAEPKWFNVVAVAQALGVSCESFTKPPTAQDKPGPGRPAKATPEAPESKTKKARGRPKKGKP